MKNAISWILFFLLCLDAHAQISYPYNPDGNADSLIGVSDIQDLLTNYNQPFAPSDIMLDSIPLETFLYSLSNSVDDLNQALSALSLDLDEIIHLQVVEILNGLGVETCNPTFNDSALVDVQGNVYRSVQIGAQEWLAEPYRCTAYNDGTPISQTNNIYQNDNGTFEPTAISNPDTTLSACFYAHDVARSNLFPPAGWRLPTPSDLQILIDNNGGANEVGAKMKDISFGLWDYPNTGATNCLGFGAIPFGALNSYGSNLYSGETARYCLKQGNSYTGTWYFILSNTSTSIAIDVEQYGAQYGLVRFVKE